MNVDKRARLAAAIAAGTDFENRLFFAARNLAIEAMLLRLTVKLRDSGFPTAECVWSESSFGAPVVEFRFRNPKPDSADSWEYGKCTLRLIRDRVLATAPVPSDLFYEVKSLEATEYWRGPQPSRLLTFRAAVQAMFDSGELAKEVLKVNYPFDYQSHSSF
jgi:hypothetical protein